MTEKPTDPYRGETLDPDARKATFDPYRCKLILWQARFERSERTCETLEQAQRMVAATGVPQTIEVELSR